MVSGEIILNRLIRKKDNIMLRPDFSCRKMPEYQVCTIRKALWYNKSPLIGLSFEQLKRQLLNSNLSERTGTSFLDANFYEKLSTKSIKKYQKSIEKMEKYMLNTH